MASLADGLEISSIDEAYINLDAVDDDELPAYGQSIVKTIRKNARILRHSVVEFIDGIDFCCESP